MYTPVNPFYYIKVGFKGSKIYRHIFLMNHKNVSCGTYWNHLNKAISVSTYKICVSAGLTKSSQIVAMVIALSGALTEVCLVEQLHVFACMCFLCFFCSFYYQNYNSHSGNPAWPPPVTASYNSNAWNNSPPATAWQQHVSPNSVRNVQTTSPMTSNSSWNSPPPQTVASVNSTWTPPTPPSYNHDRLHEEYDSYNESLLNRQTYNNYSMSYDRYIVFLS